MLRNDISIDFLDCSKLVIKDVEKPEIQSFAIFKIDKENKNMVYDRPSDKIIKKNLNGVIHLADDVFSLDINALDSQGEKQKISKKLKLMVLNVSGNKRYFYHLYNYFNISEIELNKLIVNFLISEDSKNINKKIAKKLANYIKNSTERYLKNQTYYSKNNTPHERTIGITTTFIFDMENVKHVLPSKTEGKDKLINLSLNCLIYYYIDNQELYLTDTVFIKPEFRLFTKGRKMYEKYTPSYISKVVADNIKTNIFLNSIGD